MAGKRGVPTIEEIAKLPRWAQVAFAARCARRVQPLFKAARPDAPQRHIEAVERAVIVGERAAAYARTVDVAKTAEAAYAAGYAARAAEGAYAGAAYAAAAAAYAAYSARAARGGADASYPARAAEAAEAAAGLCVESLIRQDFERLAAGAKKGEWTYKTAVPRGFFGPLWAEGEEPDWGKIAKKLKEGKGGKKEKVFERGPMSLYFDRAEFSDKDIAEMISKLSELYYSISGDRLVIKGTGLLLAERAPVPEGV